MCVMPPPEIPQATARFPWLPRVNVRRPGFDVATGFVILIVVIQWLVARAGGPSYMADLFVQLGLTWPDMKSGKVWQLLSYAFLHGSWAHLLVNALMIWLIGGRIIHILGYRSWLKIVFWGVLLGGALHVLTSMMVIGNGFQDARLVGASGACYALLIALTKLSPDSKMWPVPVSGRTLGLALILSELLLWLMRPELEIPVLSAMGQVVIKYIGSEIFYISHACHFGGAIAGWWLAGRLLGSTPSLVDLQEMRKRNERKMSVNEEL